MTKPLPGQLGYGMPPRDPSVDLVRTAKDLQSQLDTLRSTQQQLIQAIAGYQTPAAVSNDTTFREYGSSGLFAVPGLGYDRLTFILWCSSGITFTGAGTVGMFPSLVNVTGPTPTVAGGNALTTSTSSTGGTINTSNVLVSTTTGWSACVGSTFHFSNWAYFSGTATSSTASIMTNGLMIWTRA